MRLRVFMARLFAVISQAAGCIWGFQVRLADHLDEFLAEMPKTRISAAVAAAAFPRESAPASSSSSTCEIRRLSPVTAHKGPGDWRPKQRAAASEQQQ
jgi:hypothetical protein